MTEPSTITSPLRALTFWPEWCAAFPGVRLRDGTPSTLDKGYENRPFRPWSTIAPDPGSLTRPPGPGQWFAMHAGKHIGGRQGNDGALINVVHMAVAAGWLDTMRPRGRRLQRDVCDHDGRWTTVHTDLHPDRIVTSAIVALIRVIDVDGPRQPIGHVAAWRLPEQYGWRLEVRPLARPVTCSGAQGLWTVPTDIAAQVLTQVCT